MQIPKNIFLDRDGTIIEDKHYLSNPNNVILLPGVGTALSMFVDNGCRLFVVSNQSGIGRGMFTEEAVVACNERIIEQLSEYGVTFTDFLWCPHTPETSCTCRKPGIGMWEELSARYGLLPSETIMIGDKMSDVLFGVHAKFTASFLVKTGKGSQEGKHLGYFFPKKGVLVQETAHTVQTVIMTAQRIKDIALSFFSVTTNN